MQVRIVRFAREGSRAQWGCIDDGEVVQLQGNPFEGQPLRSHIRIPLAQVRLLAPAVPSKVMAVGRNYAEHIVEMGWNADEQPVVFLKPPSSIVGPAEAITLPHESKHCEAEVELAVVISRAGRRIGVDQAIRHVLGYTIANDVSARDLMARDGQWARAKGFDSFCPLGPWIDTEFAHESAGMRTLIDGEIVQEGNTARMRLGVPELVSRLSHSFRLEPGDVILTGSPAGRKRLRHGMSVSATIAGLGTLTNPVVEERPAD